MLQKCQCCSFGDTMGSHLFRDFCLRQVTFTIDPRVKELVVGSVPV